MSAGLNQRRRAEIDAKVESLDKELAHWKALTECEGLGLRRHHTQVGRVAEVLDGLTESVRQVLARLPEGANVLDQASSLENSILAAHSIWEVFRAKLVLREDAIFRGVLAACDDLAWECYGPAMQLFDPDRKGPPLVYFTATWSPFMTPRDSSFHNEVRAGPGAAGALREDQFLRVLKYLPIPLISVPWYHAVHLPGAIIIAHEIGHVVEFDFDLTADIAAALSNAGLEQDYIWKGWASEIFADLYGCRCMGPAFVGAMMDLLTASVSSVQNEIRSGGKYPSRALRVELMLEALQRDHAADAARLRTTWQEVYGPLETMPEFRQDVATVVDAIHAGPYRGHRLTDIISISGDAFADRTIGEAAGQGSARDLCNFTDPRRLFAGAQWLHENPQPNQHAGAFGLIVDQIGKKFVNQFRSSDGSVANEAAVKADLAARQDGDRQSGRALADLLADAIAHAPDGK
ncbi:hypothetical protein IVA93_33995 [Bradyrhizobium sp. 155]|uniref:hypothetical protein n=1 Tax=Bradyrhizobium sp. 155 TaxID=2782629 RepID=UPI001FFF4DC4|nr:hypothetical protein [Bradyrhizobium sp. 155]UPK11137.1 hypothetical protein IVA93_33995 [Bradyrhizobium sp. 155]